MAFPSSPLAAALAQATPPADAPPSSGGNPLDGLGDLFRQAMEAVLKSDVFKDAVGGLVQTLAPKAMLDGLYYVASSFGSYVYDNVGPLFHAFNIVTQRPEEITNRLDPIRALNHETSIAACGFLAVALVANLAAYGRATKKDHGQLAEDITNFVLAVPFVLRNIVFYDAFAPVFNELLARVADLSDPTAGLPAWDKIAKVDGATPEGIAKLVMAVQAVLVFVHMVVAVAWWDVLIVLCPFAVACATNPHAQQWFDRWATAVVGSVAAQFAMVVAMRVATVVTGFGAARMDGSTLPAAIKTFGFLLIGLGGMVVVVTLAKMTHAGMAGFHPFAAARTAQRRTGSLVRSVAAPFTSQPAVADAAERAMHAAPSSSSSSSSSSPPASGTGTPSHGPIVPAAA